ncbi:hypothetical protein [Marinomonas fungiae]|uniref:Uncharacterized protein n=1 Tax=Marinomonas fungiae TaxID=1137284 RepID=A0A0K6IVJ5_9GAMM|nr:hypothetical protein [Marinomonas fungiae]CUB07079.1 hypothetical protein Ga0061065_1346 [Marinomonas fungiae]
MNEHTNSYLELKSVKTLAEELSAGTTLCISDPDYTPPKTKDLELLLSDSALTTDETAELLGVSEKLVQEWLAKDPDESSSISYPAWRTLILELGVSKPDISSYKGKWWVINMSKFANDMRHNPATPIYKGPYVSYRQACNIAENKNSNSFYDYFKLHLENVEDAPKDPDDYEYWEGVYNEWNESECAMYDAIPSDDLDFHGLGDLLDSETSN